MSPKPEPRACPGHKCTSTLRHNEFACRRCIVRAERAIADLPALFAELDKTIARQTSGSGRGFVGAGGESKIPVNLSAMEKRNLAGRLTALACEVGYWLPSFDLPGTVFAVLTDPSKMQYKPNGPDLMALIHRTVSELRGVIDTQQDRVFAGRCGGCNAELYARPDRPKTVCTSCSAEYDTADQLEWVEDQLRDTLWPIRLIRQALANWGDVRVSDSTVRSWRRRGQLVAKGIDLDGAETYRVGDYLDLAEDLKTRTEPERTTSSR